MKHTLVVLAAGLGSRYGGLKQMDGFGPGGETLLEYSLYDAWIAGFRRFVFVIRRSMEVDFRERVMRKLPAAMEVELCFQELQSLPVGFRVPEGRSKPWGTGHAVWVARHAIPGPFAVVNGDDFYGRDGFCQLSRHFAQTEGTSHAMVAYPLGKTLSDTGGVSRGICRVNEQGLLLEMREVTGIRKVDGGWRWDGEAPVELEADTAASMNLFGLSHSILARMDQDFGEFLESRGTELTSEFYLPSVVNRLIRENIEPVHVLRSADDWMGVTHPEDRPQVVAGIAAKVQTGQYPTGLWTE